MNKKCDLAVYISSFDGCSDLWKTFFMIFDQYWADCSYSIYLINNEKVFNHKNVKTIHTGPEVNWFNRTIKSLEILNEEYILFLLEDYFVSKKIENTCVEEIIKFMVANDVFYYQLSSKKYKTSEKIRYQIIGGTNYPISLQPAIWKREELLKFLYKINKKSPWDFEVYLNEKYKSYEGLIDGVYYDVRDILGYKNGVLRGKWFQQTLNFYKKKGIYIEIGNREKLSYASEIKYRLAVWVSENFSRDIKEKIKIWLKKNKIDYVR